MYDPAIPPEIKPQVRQSVSDDDPGRVMAVMEQSELLAEAFGEHVFDFFLRNKREEWSDYRRQVTRFELDRYLPML
jgi:glutamine synthetase